MPKIKIDRDKCKGCKLCIMYCPKGLICLDETLNKRGVLPAVFKDKGCTGCLSCAIICPDVCIEVFK